MNLGPRSLLLLLLLLLPSPLLANDLCSWTGGWDNVPDEATDQVVIESGDLTWDAGLPDTVASWDQKNSYSNTVTFDTRFPGQGNPQLLTISGDCIVSNGTWTHTDNAGTETYRLNVAIGANFEIAAGVLVHGDQKGFASGTASGAHGGKSGGGGGPTYGSIPSPINLGVRQSNFDGGGAIRIDVTGATTLNGTLSVAGRNSGDHWQGGGAGGSIWLTTGSLTGSGTLRANGGSSGAGAASGGSGGRVSIILGGGTSFGGVTCTAYGGQGNGTSGYGAAGTVYLEKSTDIAGMGELIVDNNGNAPTTYGVSTDLNGSEAVSYEFARLTLRNSGILGIGSDDTLVMTNTTLIPDPDDDEEGINIAGGTLTVPPTFAYSNTFIQVSASGSSFDPTTSLTVGTNGILLLDAPHTVSGDLTFESGARLTHTDNVNSEDYRVDLTVGGDLVFETGSEANVDFLGFRTFSGAPGSGSHGGEDGLGSGTTYGSIHAPTNIGSGSGSGWDGGGAVKLTVAGATTLDGTISANGRNSGDCWQLAGSGGSVWLTSSTLSGFGTIRANGAISGGCLSRGSGGGRIAATLTNGTSFGSVTMTAYGGDSGSDGAAGTIYLRTKGQSASEGTLLVKNNGMGGSGHTDISSSVLDRSVGVVQIFDGGRFELSGGVEFQVARVWSNANVFTAGTGTEVEMVTTNTAHFYGDTTFASLTATNADKRLEFNAGDTIGIDAFVTIRGNSTTDVKMRSITDGVQWQFDIDAAAIGTFEDVDVKDSNADAGATATAIDSTDSLNNINWIFTVGGLTNTWLGGTSTDWSDGANWSEGRPPIAADAATIISAGTFDPLLPSAQVLNTLIIQAGADLGLNGFNLTVEADLDVDGAITATGAETLTFIGDVDFSGGMLTRANSTTYLSGSGAQSVTSGDNAFYTLIVTNDGRTVTFTDVVTTEMLRDESVNMTFSGGITGTHVRVYSDEGAITLTFGAGTISQTRDLFLLGESGKIITLLSSSGGAAWQLELLRRPVVRYVHVTDSDAGAGESVYPVMSVNGGNNSNWFFGATVLVWDGSASTDFSTAANWTPATSPNPLSRVLIDGNYVNPPVISSVQSVRELQIGADRASDLKISAALTVAEDFTVYGFGVVTADVPVSIGGDCVFMDGGQLTHSANGATEAYKVDFTIGGNLALDAGSEVNTDLKGYASGAPGSGSHGGERGGGVGATYGSIIAPTNLGSVGSHAHPGGGAIRFDVAGATALNGTLSVNGGNTGDHNGTGSAGGSVWLTTSTLTGSGTIRANGGVSGAGAASGGGGGRIAIVLTSGSTFGNVTNTTYGGAVGRGGPGTVYLQTGGQSATEGTLIIENEDATSTAHADISPDVLNASVGEVLIRSTGRLKVSTDAALEVSRVWSNANVFAGETESKVGLLTSNTFRFYGNTTFASLSCTNADKRLEFNAGDTIAIDEFLTLRGDGLNKKELRSMADGSQWKLDLDAAAVTTLVDLDVKDSDARPGATATAFDSTDSLNNSNWVFTVAGLTNTWIGVTNTEWSSSANWDLGRTPNVFDDKVVISDGAFDPLLPSDQTLNKLDILAGAVLSLDSHNLTVIDALTCSGSLSASGTESLTLKGDLDFTGGTFTQAMSTVLLAGTAAQSITSDGNAFYRLTLTNVGRIVTFTDVTVAEDLLCESVSMAFNTNATAAEYRVHSDAGVVTQQFAAGATVTVEDLVLHGDVADSIVLKSSSEGSQWHLDVTRSEYVKNARVRDSNADVGLTIYPITSTDDANNSNWVFNAAWRVWDGSDNSNFGDSDNWTPAGPIDGNSRVLIDGSYLNAPEISAATSVRSIMIGVNEPSTLKIGDALTVGEDLNLFGYATVTSDVPVIVSNNMTMVTGSFLSHSANGSTEAFKIDFTIGGNLALDTGTEIDVEEKGYASGAPGSGSHGGQRGGGFGATYGSIIAPTNFGSVGSQARPGGGAVRFDVAGETVLNGTISAKGGITGDHNGTGSAGGSVWLRTATLTGSGTIRANGGLSGSGGNSGGGGGRISVVLTSGITFGNVTHTAYGVNTVGGGTTFGGSGTIYKSGGGTDTVILDNGGNAASDTHLPPSLGPFDEDFISTTFSVRNGARMGIITNVRIEALALDTASEQLDLGDPGDLVTLRRISINGTIYIEGGFYSTNDWNGFALPPNVSGSGTIFLLSPGGSVLEFR